ncbi:hypothetical protein [Thermoplasma volcanium GSS1]|uniref:Putative adenylate kinase n=1 Tax=Thermoplasma volcanium (strain ATCC 51530 / DSM 4299 / JCM 9571 / NBRC 15438 / GSS1) TaxID=273116 RepID=KAD6_THEVO|nr:adenylate kinase family protein [Thermoplasma volcanium]Q97B38.1 RecName: Full=Putative adenylate kinase; Short=AK; AltName: Full=ATP-AMP transphosphorylase [Thermoplasma volcanium GSS1]BAB59763.1 hypothetical protein [Thermoplasma volcanium GSS1]
MGKIACITGPPGAGKSTVCSKLREYGYNCKEGNELAKEYGCLFDEEVDVECLEEKLAEDRFDGIICSHYSHLLGCSTVFILEADLNDLIDRMRARGYSEEKIQENIETQMSSIFYYESLERLPANRIFTLYNGNIDETAKRIISIIERSRNNK